MSKKDDNSQTASEFLKELETDQAFRARREKREALVREYQERVRASETPVIEALTAVGVKVQSVWDLVNTRATYAAAIPVILQHLQLDYPPEVREGLARALAVPEASSAWETLLKLFEQEPPTSGQVKWALACALSGAATDQVLDQIIAMIREPAIGENRLALLPAVARSALPEARKALEELRSDPQLSREIRILVGRPKPRR